MTRSVDDLAADVRACLTVRPLLSETRMEAEAALSELVLQANGWRAIAEDVDGNLFCKRAEAAESALADMRRAAWAVVEANYATAGEQVAGKTVLWGAIDNLHRALAAAGPAPEETT